MPADEVGRAFQVAAVEMQVAAAEGGAGDFEDHVGGVLEFGHRSILHLDLFEPCQICLGTLGKYLHAWKSPFSTTARIFSGKPIVDGCC